MKKQSDHNHTRGWGIVDKTGAEIWDANPVFLGDRVTVKDRCKLFFYPKRFVLYRAIEKHIQDIRKRYREIEGGDKYVPKILDVGCGTGASVIDFKKMFGRRVDVVGVDVVKLQIELAEKKMRRHGVWAAVSFFDGTRLPFDDNAFDAVYTSDVLGHVEDAPAWLFEIHRVLRPGGLLAMFAESKLGKHAYIRKYLFDRGLNTDPHAAFHISLFGKATLLELLEQNGFEVERAYTTVWAKFFMHPDELRPAFQAHGGFFFLRNVNACLTWMKKKTHPFSTAVCELYSLIEMLLIGKWVESQGYVFIARKR